MQIVIPAYNEAGRLPATLVALHRRARELSAVVGHIEVIVVDNCSTDGTAAVAASHDSPLLPVRVVSCPVPGKGAAVRAGIAVTSHDMVAFMDADGATDLDAIAEGWRHLVLGADVAVASRAVEGSVTQERHTWLRARGASAFRALSQRVVPGIVDTQCGFKMMRGALARTLGEELVATGFSFDVELLARAVRHRAVLREFPVRWTDVPGSTFSPARHGADAFLELAEIAWRVRRTAPAPVLLPSAVVPGAVVREAGVEA